MHAGALTAQQSRAGRGALRASLATSGAVLALALAAVLIGLTAPAPIASGAEQGRGLCTQSVHGAERSKDSKACLQPGLGALPERDALSGTSPSASLSQHLLAARTRARLQPDTQSTLRVIRERQDALLTALSHRLRDASEPGAASHPADRPRIVTRPLRGPPSLA